MADNNNDLYLNQDPLPPKGNRPADNARQATPASLLAQMNWQGGDTAEDFLGLNGDPAPSAPAPIAAPVMPQASAPRAASQASDNSWLMDANPHAQRELNAHVEPPEPLDVEDGSEEPSLRAPAVLDASWSEPREPRGSSKRPLVAALAALAIVAAAGGAFMKFKSGSGQPAANEATLALAPEAAASKPKPRAPGEIEIPKSPTGAAAGSASKGTPSTARVPLDRSGRAAPVVEPQPSEPPASSVAATPPQAQPPRAKPKFVAAPAASAPLAPAPEPTPAPEVAAAKEPEPLLPDAPATQPGALSQPPSQLVARSPQAEPPVRPALQAPEASGTTPGSAQSAAPVEPLTPSAPTPIAQEPIAQAPTQDPGAAPVGAAPETQPEQPVAEVVVAPADPVAIAPSPAPEASSDVAGAAPAPAPRVISTGEAPRIRVIGSSSAPLGEAQNARPAVDELRDAVPTQAPGVTPAPAADAATIPGVDPSGGAAAQAPATANRAGILDARDVLLPAAPTNGVRVAQAKDKISVWDGTEIPMEHLATKPKVLTPQVGEVRVKLKSKDVFEGRLYAIGENAVWLEGAYGRMSLDNARIVSVEKVVAPGSGAAGKGGAPSLSERVRVKTPGGLVFGKVISKEQNKITLLTDAGLTLTVEATVVEYLAPAPSLIIKKEAPKK